MPRGHYKRREQTIDHRQILALLPGRMIVKQLIDREIALIRASIKAGQHMEYLALLPGLEIEEKHVNEGLGAMAEMMQTGAKADVVQMISEQPLLAAPKKDKMTAEALDASTIIERPFVEGQPTFVYLLLKELMEKGEADRNDFAAKHDCKLHTISATLVRLKKYGVKIKALRGTGRLVLVSKIEGELPTAPISKTARAKMPDQRFNAPVRIEKKVKRVIHNPRKGTGKQEPYLLKHFEEKS